MSRQTRRNNDMAALARRHWIVADFTPTGVTMDEKACLDLAVSTAYEIEAQNKAKGAKAAGPMLGKLADLLTWLRAQNVPWPRIFAALPQILAAMAAGNWAAVIAALITIFGLPAETVIPPAP